MFSVKWWTDLYFTWVTAGKPEYMKGCACSRWMDKRAGALVNGITSRFLITCHFTLSLYILYHCFQFTKTDIFFFFVIFSNKTGRPKEYKKEHEPDSVAMWRDLLFYLDRYECTVQVFRSDFDNDPCTTSIAAITTTPFQK